MIIAVIVGFLLCITIWYVSTTSICTYKCDSYYQIFVFYFFCKLIILISFNCFLIKFDSGLKQTILSINDIIYYFFHLMLLKYFISSVYFIF